MAEMAEVLALVVLLLLVTSGQGRSDFVADEENLRQALLTNYTAKVRPEMKTHISVNAALMSLNHLDIASQSMSVNVVLSMEWNDSRLKWNTSEHEGLTSFVTAPEDVWTPSLVIENSVDHVGVIGGKNLDATPLRIFSGGMVEWLPPMEATVSCEVQISQYPFDTQTCSIVVIGWTYPLSEMDMTIGAKDTTGYFTNGEFELVAISPYYQTIEGSTEESSYRKGIFQFTFRRKWQFYGQNLLMPIALSSVMMNAVFLLPIESGEKMGFCLTVLLSYSLPHLGHREPAPRLHRHLHPPGVHSCDSGSGLPSNVTYHLGFTPVPPAAHKPLSRFYVILATRVLVPLRHCTSFGKKEDSLGKDEPVKQGKDSVSPINSCLSSGKIEWRRPSEFGVVNITKASGKALPKSDVDMLKNQQTSNHGAGEATDPALTWQELAALLDCCLFWAYAVSLVAVTTVIFSLLYVNY